MWRIFGKNGAKFNFEHETHFELSELIGRGDIVGEAMEAFLDSTDFESAVENAIARGGDINTRAIIAGSIAEGFYGIPNADKEYCNRLLPESMLEVLDWFDNAARRNFVEVSTAKEYLTDELIEETISRYNRNVCAENRLNVLNQLYHGMYSSGNLRIPIVVPDRQKVYDEGKLTDDSEYLTHQTDDGKKYVVTFTNDSPEMCETYPDIYLGTIEDVFAELVDDDETSGIILNPDNDDLRFVLEKADVKKILDRTPPENKLLFFDGNIEELPADAVVTSDCEDFKNISFENFNEITAAHFMTGSSSCTIYTPLMFYDGYDEEVILNCYCSCLNLAKKYHLASVAFPSCFINPFLNEAISNWFDANEEYGMTVIVASGNSEDINDGKERHFFAVHFVDKEISTVQRNEETVTVNNFVDKAKSEAYRKRAAKAPCFSYGAFAAPSLAYQNNLLYTSGVGF